MYKASQILKHVLKTEKTNFYYEKMEQMTIMLTFTFNGRQRLAGAVAERWLPNKTESSALTVHAGTTKLYLDIVKFIRGRKHENCSIII